QAEMQDMIQRLATPEREGAATCPIQACHVLQKMTPEDDVEAYLLAFERCAEREAWPRAQWAGIMAPFLVEDAQRAYFDLEPEAALDYTQLKTEILARARVTLTVWAQQFYSWRFQEDRAPRLQMFNLIHLAGRWPQLETNSPAQIVKMLVIDHFLPTIRKWVGQGNPSNAQKLIALVERQLTVKDLVKTPSSATSRGGTEEQLQTAKGLSGAGEGWSKGSRGNGDLKKPEKGYWCYRCNELGHSAIQCPNEVEPMQCGMGEQYQRGGDSSIYETHKGDDGKEIMALTDMGSTVTLVSGSLVKPSKLEHTWKTGITCVHGDVNYYPTARLQVEIQNRSFNILVGVVPKLPHPVILGRD
uniref:CCHC-type domain-containing protein n=1 Tax=Latimeria chalumnae TaxID=7897 RepID=H3A6K6_LATCH